MLKTFVPRASRSILQSRASLAGPANLRTKPSLQIVSQNLQSRRGYASEASDYDVIFVGGGVAGYVGAIKAGQEGLKVYPKTKNSEVNILTRYRQHVLKREDPWEAHV